MVTAPASTEALSTIRLTVILGSGVPAASRTVTTMEVALPVTTTEAPALMVDSSSASLSLQKTATLVTLAPPTVQ
jgi:hypothetical protein